MLLTTLLVVSLAAIGCASDLGRGVPECETAGATMVLATQAVPGSPYVSCIDGLKAGWDYNHLTAMDGRSTYTLDSDRLGSSFLRVDNVESCDVGMSELDGVSGDGIELWKDIEVSTTVDIVLVPEGLTRETASSLRAVVEGLDGVEIEGKALDVTTSVSDLSTRDRIREAIDAGAHVIVISIRNAEEGTLTVRLAGSVNEVLVDDLDDAIDAIEDVESESTYVGTWHYVFDGGCVVYTFDAEGGAVTTIESDVETALSLMDAEELRQSARDAGFRVP